MLIMVSVETVFSRYVTVKEKEQCLYFMAIKSIIFNLHSFILSF